MTAGLNEPSAQLEKRAELKGIIFIGTVVENRDPSGLERVRVFVPELIGAEVEVEQCPWAIPVHSRVQGMSPNVGSFGVPVIGSEVFVEFQQGDPAYPMYWGGVVSKRNHVDLALVNYPARYGMQDARGNYLYVDTAAGDIEIFHFSGLKVRIEPTGQVQIQAPSNVNINITGNATLQVGGNVDAQATGDMTFNAGGNFRVSASGIALNSSGDCVSNSGGTFAVQASDIRWNG